MTTSGITNPMRRWQRSQHYRPGLKYATVSNNQTTTTKPMTRRSTDESGLLDSCIETVRIRRKRGEEIAKLPFNAYKTL